MSIPFFALIGFFCGSFPTAYLYCRFIHKVDIRTLGSGNPGATNVFRNFGKRDGWIVLLIDAIKGFIPAALFLQIYSGSIWVDQEPSIHLYSIAIATVAGHLYSPFLRFKGGKGVATGAGAMLAVLPTCLLPAVAVWIVLLKTFRYMSLASLGSAYAFTMIAAYQYRLSLTTYIAFFLALVLTYTHRTNIARLFKGTEPKFSFSKQSPR